MNRPEQLTVAQDLSISSLDIQEYDIDLLDDGSAATDVPGITTVTTSSWPCVTITIVSVSVTSAADCI